jgi:hypothetical protein
MQADKPGDSARRAASRMKQAEDKLEAGAGDQAAAEQSEALEDLEQAQRELSQAQREAEEQLAFELLEKIADRLAGMIDRQQNVIDETKRLDELFRSRGNWTRAQLKSLTQLADQQQQLKKETDGFVESLKTAEVFALALRGASRQMERAASRLSERKTDAETVAAETQAKQRFVDLVASLKQDKSDVQTQQQSSDNQGQQQSGSPADGIPQVAQLKLLKSLQQDLERRTTELDKLRTNGGFTAEQEAEIAALADEQGSLADLARNLMRAVTEAFDAENEKPTDRQREENEDSK